MISTEHLGYGGNGFVIPEKRNELWRLPGEHSRLLSRCTTVLKAVETTDIDRLPFKTTEEKMKEQQTK